MRKRSRSNQAQDTAKKELEEITLFSPPELESEWPHLLTIFLILLGVYVYSAPRTVTLEDSGLFILSSYFGGISHPPGYPLHSLLGKLFTLIPIGSIAFRVHLLSAVCGAGTCAALFWIARSLKLGLAAAYAAPLAYGLSQTFWSQSIIAEVYSLNAFLFVLLVAICLHYRFSGDLRQLYSIAFVYGLSLTNHWPLIGLATPCLLAITFPRWPEVLKSLHKATPFLLVGLSPYVYMVIRSQMDPLISFVGPIDSFARFKYVVGRELYLNTVSPVFERPWLEKSKFALFYLTQLIEQFSWLGALLALIGCALQWKKWKPSISMALVLGFLANSVLLAYLFEAPFEFIWKAVLQVFPLLAYALFALWMGLGLQTVFDRAEEKFKSPKPIWRTLAAALLPILAFSNSMRTNFRQDYNWASEYARTVLESLKEDSVYFTQGDLDLAILGYMSLVEGVGPKVELFSVHGAVFNNRLFDISADENLKRKAICEFIERSDRPIYFTMDFPHQYGHVDYGLYSEVDKSIPKGKVRLTARRELFDYFRWLESQDDATDPWTIYHRQLLMGRIARMLTQLVYETDNPRERRELQPILDSLTRSYHGMIGKVEMRLYEESPEQLHQWLGEAEAMSNQALTSEMQARLHSLLAEVFIREGNQKEAVANLKQSISIFPSWLNPAIDLMREYEEAGRTE